MTRDLPCKVCVAFARCKVRYKIAKDEQQFATMGARAQLEDPCYELRLYVYIGSELERNQRISKLHRLFMGKEEYGVDRKSMHIGGQKGEDATTVR